MILIGATGTLLIVIGAYQLIVGIAILRHRDPLPYQQLRLNEMLIRRRTHRVTGGAILILLGICVLSQL